MYFLALTTEIACGNVKLHVKLPESGYLTSYSIRQNMFCAVRIGNWRQTACKKKRKSVKFMQFGNFLALFMGIALHGLMP